MSFEALRNSASPSHTSFLDHFFKKSKDEVPVRQHLMIFAGMLTSAENILYIRNTETSWGRPEAGM